MVNIDNFEKLLEEYNNLLNFYKSELAKLPDMNLHYKKQGERYYACISQNVGGKRVQKRIARDVGTNKDLEEKLRYKKALAEAVEILQDDIHCLQGVLYGSCKKRGKRFVSFDYIAVDQSLPRGFCADGWSFAKYMRSAKGEIFPKAAVKAGGLGYLDVSGSGGTGIFGQYDAEEWIKTSFHPEYKQAVLFRDADKLKFDTGQGFRVRSKSEVLISTLAGQAGLLFKYEEPIELIVHSETKRLYEKFCRNVEAGGRKIMLPDFTILAPDGKLWLWEHQGMMDDPQYLEKYYFRHDMYARNGFMVGKNLIFTFESDDEPLSVGQVEKIIKYILG